MRTVLKNHSTAVVLTTTVVIRGRCHYYVVLKITVVMGTVASKTPVLPYSRRELFTPC